MEEGPMVAHETKTGEVMVDVDGHVELWLGTCGLA